MVQRFELPSQLAAACAALASGLAAFVAAAAEVATQVLGVPLPVALAALTGACGARVFLPEAKFWRAFGSCVFWTFAGSYCAQLALWLAGRAADGDAPSGALAGVALVTAALGQRLAPILWEKSGAVLERFLDGIGKGGGK